jgi:ATP-dependent Clp protease ATP-binding subunit ClpA
MEGRMWVPILLLIVASDIGPLVDYVPLVTRHTAVIADMAPQKYPESFDDFNEASRITLFYARSAVAELGGVVITPEHLLLGLLQASPEAVVRFLGPSDSIEVITQQVREKAPTGDRVSEGVNIPMSREADLVLRKAVEDTTTGPSKVVRPEHILLALLETNHGPAVDVLRKHGVVEGDIRNYLRELNRKP